MSIIIFLIILSVLVIVHELGHFFVAKKADIRVDEFGLGYPPRAKKLLSWKGTDFTLNWLPFGGFVKIFGENYDENAPETPNKFTSKKKIVQAAVLVAGVTANFVFAWALISFGFMTGLPAPAGLSYPVTDTHTAITVVLPGSPAALGGLKSGDTITSLSRGNLHSNLSPENAASFIAASPEPLTIVIQRGPETLTKTITPKEGIVEGHPALGISMDTIGIVKLNPIRAIYEGFITSVKLTKLTAVALLSFVGNALIGDADLSQVTGPVGLVAMVGDVRVLGFAYLLSFTALISINLALVNLLPIPALDGGRLLFVGIEALMGRPIKPKFFNAINTVGFALLIILMIAITVRDVTHLL